MFRTEPTSFLIGVFVCFKNPHTKINFHNAFLKSKLNLIVAVIALASVSNTVFAQTPLKIERDIVFDAAHQHKADIFHPAGNGTFQAIVLVPGGGWTSGNKAQMDVFGKRFSQEGWVAVSIEYRLVSPAKATRKYAARATGDVFVITNRFSPPALHRVLALVTGM